jgi:hypothetical protein
VFRLIEQADTIQQVKDESILAEVMPVPLVDLLVFLKSSLQEWGCGE